MQAIAEQSHSRPATIRYKGRRGSVFSILAHHCPTRGLLLDERNHDFSANMAKQCADTSERHTFSLTYHCAKLRPLIAEAKMTTPQKLIVVVPLMAVPWVLPRILSFYAKRRGTSSLRPMVPVLGTLCWILWIATGVFMVAKSDSTRYVGIFIMLYSGISIVFYWVRAEAAFEKPQRESSIRSSVLRVPVESYVGVGNPPAVSDWYVRKLGMRKLAANPGGTVGLKFGPDGESLILEPRDTFYERRPLVLFTRRIKKARSVLVSRGLSVGEIETDRQGTHYFEIRDPEGNVIEVSEEPAGALGGEIL